MTILEGCYFLLSIEAALCTIRAARSQRSFGMLHKTERKLVAETLFDSMGMV